MQQHSMQWLKHTQTYILKLMQGALCGKREHALKLRSVGGHMAQGVEGGNFFLLLKLTDISLKQQDFRIKS